MNFGKKVNVRFGRTQFLTGYLFLSDMLFNLALNFHSFKVNLIWQFKAMYIPPGNILNSSKEIYVEKENIR